MAGGGGAVCGRWCHSVLRVAPGEHGRQGAELSVEGGVTQYCGWHPESMAGGGGAVCGRWCHSVLRVAPGEHGRRGRSCLWKVVSLSTAGGTRRAWQAGAELSVEGGVTQYCGWHPESMAGGGGAVCGRWCRSVLRVAPGEHGRRGVELSVEGGVTQFCGWHPESMAGGEWSCLWKVVSLSSVGGTRRAWQAGAELSVEGGVTQSCGFAVGRRLCSCVFHHIMCQYYFSQNIQRSVMLCPQPPYALPGSNLSPRCFPENLTLLCVEMGMKALTVSS
ncbi:PREDICTED: uncharacterized protein LOC108521828 [Rhinopithecus bieti]|uniref:uncharacterized protein LOC108521828 n=1 Tax=Rhinopithecus bieti TaxID=61621 RepID=UPI00083C20C9|nr:PREDICTED: uncharacterized protein LOC108521828 [Rhinopithecus bieti]